MTEPDLRALIARWIGSGPHWLVDAYLDLLDQGVDPDEAIVALDRFVDDLIAMKLSAVKKIPTVEPQK